MGIFGAQDSAIQRSLRGALCRRDGVRLTELADLLPDALSEPALRLHSQRLRSAARR